MSFTKAGFDEFELCTILVHTRESWIIEKRLEVGDVFGHTDWSRNRFTLRRKTERSQTRVTGTIHAISNKPLLNGDGPNIVTTTSLIFAGIKQISPYVCKYEENQYDRGR